MCAADPVSQSCETQTAHRRCCNAGSSMSGTASCRCVSASALSDDLRRLDPLITKRFWQRPHGRSSHVQHARGVSPLHAAGAVPPEGLKTLQHNTHVRKTGLSQRTTVAPGSTGTILAGVRRVVAVACRAAQPHLRSWTQAAGVAAVPDLPSHETQGTQGRKPGAHCGVCLCNCVAHPQISGGVPRGGLKPSS